MYAKPMFLEEKLGDNLPVHFQESVLTTELFGIEVELEGKGGIANPTDKVLMEWLKHNDGSLRKLNPGDEAIEYVTKTPRNKLRAAKSLMTLMEFLTGPDKVVYDSYRTSIHVHVNCMADKMIHVYNFITLCIIFDELLASQNGEHRIGNNFCLRARDAEGQIADLVNSINIGGHIFNLNGQWRYSAINFASLCKFGTVEFRSLECTTDTARILQWIEVIDSMKKASREFDNPQQIIRGFSNAFSVQDFCKLILGDMAQKYIEVPGFDRMLFDGMRLAQDFAFCSKWIFRTKPEQKPKEAVKKKLFMDFEAPQMHAWGQQAPENGNNLNAAMQYFGLQGNAVPPPPQPAYQAEPIDDPDIDGDIWDMDMDEDDI